MRSGEPVELSRLEFDLLASLLRAGGDAVSRDRLLREVWGIARPDRIRTRTIDTHIAALRNKLEDEPEFAQLSDDAREKYVVLDDTIAVNIEKPKTKEEEDALVNGFLSGLEKLMPVTSARGRCVSA